MKDPIPGLRAQLRSLRTAAGEPALEILHRHAALLGRHLPTSTAHDLVSGSRLPRWPTVESFVRACLHHAKLLGLKLPQDMLALAHWRSAYEEAAGRIGGDVRRSPCQLPLASRLFTNRDVELGLIDTAVSSIFLITGLAGTGKTSLALRWAQENVDDFPDGQLYVDMRGFGPTGAPLSAGDAARCLLDALDVDLRSLQTDQQSLFNLLRSSVAGKRLLILLDNVRDSATVEPLLPGDRSCVVLVTSRNRLSNLIANHETVPIVLDALDPEQARVLLGRHIGSTRVSTEAAAAEQLLEHCGGLPLALVIIAARVAAHPSFPLATMSSDLMAASSRLNTLDAGELAVNLRAVFSWSYDDQSAEAATLLTLLSLTPGVDIGLPAAAALMDSPVERIQVLLDELDRSHLVQQHLPGRYRMHDLVRAYAQEFGDRMDTAAALYRLICFYLHTADRADDLLDPQMQQIALSGPDRALLITDRNDAQTWFTTEHRNLLAAQCLAQSRGWHDLTWQLAWTFDSFHYRQGHLLSNVSCWGRALESAGRLAEPAAIAVAERYFGRALARAGYTAEAVEHLRRALAYTEQTEDRYGQAHVHYSMGWVFELGGDDELALLHSTRALRLFRDLGDPTWEARLLTKVGWDHARLGQHKQAVAASESALTAHRSLGDEYGQIDALHTLGYVSQSLGQHTEAREHFRQAVDLCRKAGHSYAEATNLVQLGDAYAALEQPDRARKTWQAAADLLRSQARTAEYAQVDARLAQGAP
ncbi:tetratricopeptide repeat protein [Amycolatopsis vastitatis]|uniref:SARP family transcriptional regulator n=1 Tax=Amycolatopsis vastitatis TaxID=1905142 RepID=A0A229TBH8_9PSEU|nr:tetratricopeptide repeat protein [Amycolatopsis vastitatis]OXM68274.1 SARP family transcriptional regulator [Amycolatopsis vastitatis]